MNASLLRALRVVVRADTDPTRTVLFERLAARRRVVRLARWVIHVALRGRLPAVLAVASYGMLASRACVASPRTPIWALPLYENDRRQIDRVARLVGGGVVGRAESSLRLVAGAGWLCLGALSRQVGRRYLRAVRRFCRRYDFLVSCRLATALAAAMTGVEALRRSVVRAVLVSSDYNAEAVGLAHAARSAGRATIYVAHAPVHHISPALDFTLAILDGEAALAAYRLRGPVAARCVFMGVSGTERPLRPETLNRRRPVIGLFLPKEVDWQTFAAIVGQAAELFGPSRLLVRWHPNALERPSLRRFAAGLEIEACPSGSALDADASRCDWVLADRNSSVSLSVLKAGVPVVPIAGLAVFPDEQSDLYGLVRDGVVPPPCRSLHEVEAVELASFYGAGWSERFGRYDGGYGRPVADVERELRAAVLEVVAVRGGDG